MRVGESYKHYKEGRDFDVIVIGSGIGGLTAASFLADSGKRVLVLEKHYAIGGFTHVFSRRDYEWDVGVHYLGDVGYPPAETARIFRYLSRGKLKWAAMDECYDRLIFPDRSYDLIAGKEAYMRQLENYFPNEKAAIQAYFERLPKVTGWRSKLFFAEKALPNFITKPFGKWMRSGFLKHAGKTTAATLAEIGASKELSAVLIGQMGDYGLPPQQSSFAIQAMVASHYMYGGYYPVGGSAQFAETIVPPILEKGGKVLLRAEVKELLLKDGKAAGVRMADGGEFQAPVIISNAGFRTTMQQLVPKDRQLSDKDLEEMGLRSSVGHVCLYIGLKDTAEALALPKTNLWIYPSYDHDANFARYAADPKAEFPVVYISFPAAKDPDFANRFPGRSTIEIITMQPWEGVAKWADLPWKKRGEEYEAWKADISARLLAHLYAQVPSTKGKVDYHELSSPLSTQHFSNYPKGELYGLDHTPARFQQRKLGVKTEIPGFYLCGQDSVSCGVAGGMFGGVLCASAVMKGNVMGKAFKWCKDNP